VAHDTSRWERLRLDTARLCLRAPTPRDAEALYDLFADPEVMHGLGKEPVSALEEARAMIDEGIDGWRTDGLGPFILETAATERRVVGQAGLMIFDTRGWTPSNWANAGSHAQPELGWALMRAHWGHGYATEAAAAIRDWAHECRSIDRLVSLISSDNVRSRRVAERLGAIPTETVTPTDSGDDGRLETSARRSAGRSRVVGRLYMTSTIGKRGSASRQAAAKSAVPTSPVQSE
jgi:RimJ/RimL family protein N-acetyltransferase